MDRIRVFIRKQYTLPLLALLVFSATVAVGGEAYRARRVVTVENFKTNIPEPDVRESGLIREFLASSVARPMKRAVTLAELKHPKRALNVNAMDEVPDSAWYTNRIIRGQVPAAGLVRGQNVNPPPAFDGEITVTKAKSAGVSPGFTVKDNNGVVWFVKFDPPGYAEMSTAAEVITARLMWAAGYNVPEQWASTIRAERLRIARAEPGKEVPTAADIKAVLAKAARNADGSYRVVASRLVPGKIKGNFQWQGVRKDDPNDRIPHQHRRELRGLRVLCAWLNHEDIKSGNTLTSYVEENGQSFLRHYLLDFGSSLGADALGPNRRQKGHEHFIDYGVMGKSIATLALWKPPWQRNPSPIVYPSVGRFDSAHFDPREWKPSIPVAAFENMTDADAYWATRIVAAFTDEHIRTAVRSGQFSDRRAEELLAQALIERRERIKRVWFERVTPLQDLTLDWGAEPAIRFRDLAVEHGVASGSRSYTYRYWLTNEEQPLGGTYVARNTAALALRPEVLAALANYARQNRTREIDPVLHIEIRSGTAKPARAYFLFRDGRPAIQLVGVEHADFSI